jgi:hypothetical protein
MPATGVGVSWSRLRPLMVVVALVLCASCDDTADTTFRINSGGAAATPFGADVYYGGGTLISTAAAIVTTGVPDPAPAGVYQDARIGPISYGLAGLNAGTTARVRLHFAELVHNAVGLRKFHVKLNGVQVLTDFDVFQAAGGMNRAVVREFMSTVSAAGEVNIQLLNGSAGTPALNGIEILTPHQIDAGGPGAVPFVADAFVAGGFVTTDPAPIDRSAVTDPAPAAVYQTVRWGPHTYTLPSLNPGARYRLRLHFVEVVYNAAGLRRFNVAVNGLQVLTNFDIFAAAGARYRAVVKDFAATASASGQIVVALTNGTNDFPALAGLEVAPDPAVQLNAGGPDLLPYRQDPTSRALAPIRPPARSASPAWSSRPRWRCTRRGGAVPPPTSSRTSSPTPAIASGCTSPSSGTQAPGSGNSTPSSTASR